MDIKFSDLLRHGLFSSPCDKIIQSILKEVGSDSVVNIFLPEENHLSQGNISKNTFDLLKQKNIKINFIFGGFEKYYLTEKYDSPENNINLHLWPTAGMFINVQKILKEYSLLKLKTVQDTDFKFPFISLSNKAKYHRCYLIDLLAKNKLLELGCYTWYNKPGGDDRTQYDWKYTTPEVIKKTLGNDINGVWNSTIMPKEYFSSFVHLVSEGIHDGYFITEKTVIPIMHKKPFIVQGIPGFHKLLKEKMKFELYDELFDYDFDDIESMEVRTEKIIENIKNIINVDHRSLYKKIHPKLEYNQNRMIEIINQKIYVPDIVLNSHTMNNIFKFNNSIDWSSK